MDSTTLLVAATAIGALAFLARTAVLLGREPGGVDSWYYLCYARAFRKAPGLKVRLPQYLLQDQQQSYAPVFPSLLALIPEKILGRIFWAMLCVFLVLAAWFVATREWWGPLYRERAIDAITLGSPEEVFGGFYALWFDRALMRNLLASLWRVLQGFGLAVVVGVPVILPLALLSARPAGMVPEARLHTKGAVPPVPVWFAV